MTLADWLDASKERYQNHDAISATKWSAAEFLVGAGRRIGQTANYGTPFWERDWDVLIMLDACRYDLFCEVAPEYDWLPDDPGWTYSPSSMSEEWLERHTAAEYRDELRDTALISANAFSSISDVTDASDWAHLDNLVEHEWDEDQGIVLPESVTDASIDYWRHQRDGAERMISWYIQPHAPFLDADWCEGFDRSALGNPSEGKDKSVWYQLREDDDMTLEKLWPAYKQNLRGALNEVEVLLDNLDAEDVVITSDHANCIGEYGVYGHPKYVPAPPLKRVPWVEVSAADHETYRPEYEHEAADLSDDEVDERLSALGYV